MLPGAQDVRWYLREVYPELPLVDRKGEAVHQHKSSSTFRFEI